MKAIFIDICYQHIMTTKAWITLIFALVISTIYAQKIDSLEQLLPETHDIEKKIEIQTLLAKQYQVIDLEKARRIADKSLNLSLTTSTEKYLGEIYGLFGDIAVLQDSLHRAKYYYETALRYFETQNDLKGATGVTYVLGNIAFTHDDLPTAMQYYLKTAENAKASGLDDWLPGIYLNVGNIYHESGSFKEAQEYYVWSLEGIEELGNKLLMVEVYNNLGLSYYELNEPETAKVYFNNSILVGKELDAYIRIGKSMQNLSKVYEKEGDYAKAISTLLTAREYLERDNPDYAGPRQPLLATNHTLLGINYYHLNDFEKAHKHLMTGLIYSKKSGQLRLAASNMNFISQYWESNGNTDSAFYYYKLHTKYMDSLNTKDVIRKLAFQKAKLKHDEVLLIEKQERQKESELHQRNLIILIVAIAGLILALIVLALFLKLNRNKAKQAELEQKNLRTELDLRNKELTTHLMYQVKNNEFILNISNKLRNLYKTTKPENRSVLNEVIKEMELDSSTDQWEEFEVRFQQVHTDFYKNLGKKFPDLSSNELRLCAFLRLNMNTKDITAITYQSTNSITVARWRLRQKFGLNKEESLVAFLTQF